MFADIYTWHPRKLRQVSTLVFKLFPCLSPASKAVIVVLCTEENSEQLYNYSLFEYSYSIYFLELLLFLPAFEMCIQLK